MSRGTSRGGEFTFKDHLEGDELIELPDFDDPLGLELSDGFPSPVATEPGETWPDTPVVHGFIASDGAHYSGRTVEGGYLVSIARPGIPTDFEYYPDMSAPWRVAIAEGDRTYEVSVLVNGDDQTQTVRANSEQEAVRKAAAIPGVNRTFSATLVAPPIARSSRTPAAAR